MVHTAVVPTGNNPFSGPHSMELSCNSISAEATYIEKYYIPLPPPNPDFLSITAYCKVTHSIFLILIKGFPWPPMSGGPFEQVIFDMFY